jgi:dynein intermediate chain 1
LDIDESLLHKEDNQAVAQEEYHTRKKKLKSQVRKAGEEIGEMEVDSLKSMRNRLIYCERGSETLQKKIVNRDCETIKLNRINHDGIFHQWDRFDSYMSNFLHDKDKKRMEDEFKMKGKVTERKKVEVFGDSLNRPSLFKALKLLERQIMQIKNKDKYLFYREWNKFDDSQESSKMLYMLLSFPQNARIKNRSVTALCWNTKFEDLFAVGYGSYDFPSKKEDKGELENTNDEQQENGYIYVFSIKNNFFPEVKYTTESGVLCLDFHPKEFSYLVAGFYDGTVGVFDISQKIKTPIILCDIRVQKHMDPVWQVKWYTPFNEPGEYVFYSISSDGRVIKWSFYQNKTTLETEEVLKLKYSDVIQQELQNNNNNNNTNELNNTTNMNINESDPGKEKQDEALAFGNAGGMCFDFNKHKGFEHYFIIGTEEGKLYLCSTAHR